MLPNLLISTESGVHCTATVAGIREVDEVHHLFETYQENVDSNGVRERLHYLALFLKGNPDFYGLIVSYASHTACPGEAAKRAKIEGSFLEIMKRCL